MGQALLADIAIVAAIAAAVGALAVQVLRNARDVRRAWEQLRLHETALNGRLSTGYPQDIHSLPPEAKG